MKRFDTIKYQEEELIALLEDTASKLKVRNVELRVTREKLRATKMRVSKMKAIIVYQREKIMQLYRMNKGEQPVQLGLKN